MKTTGDYRRFSARWLATSWLLVALSHSAAEAANQTATVTPIQLNSALPYWIDVQPYDFGQAELPTLHSYNAAHYNGLWVMFAGRTNGVHGFDQVGVNNFPPQYQNRDVWVIDPVNKQSWSRSFDDASADLTEAEIRSLTPANTQFYQSGDRLYVTGGYGHETDDMSGPVNNTFDTLTAVDLPGIVDWVQNGTGTAKEHIRQIVGPAGNENLFTVTGGDMYEIDGRTHLVFGQDFQGNYTPGTNGVYTQQVRSFDIVDDGVNLSVANISRNPADPGDPNYRRRDLNIVPVIRPDTGSGLEQGLVVFSGVFTSTNGAWTVPVEIDAQGNPTMADPNDPDTFKQGFNGYHSAKLGLFSEASEEMHEILFGGISLQYLNTDTQTPVTDNGLPFINDITSIVIDAAGNYSQHWIGEYPELNDLDGKRLRFGANAEFFLAEGIETYDNGVIKLDELAQPTLLGYIFGGITANAPHTRFVPDAVSGASDHVFAVMYRPVPEPAGWLLLTLGATWMLTVRRRSRG